MNYQHISVLLEESVKNLKIKPEGTYVDCTLGGAGHSREIAQRLDNNGHLIGFDQDDQAIEAAKKRLATVKAQITLIRDNFINIKKALYYRGYEEVDGILFDLGFSSYQVDSEERGFSYQTDAVLDMRMDQRQKLTAKQIVNYWPEAELSKIIRDYGEEKWASRIAQFIVKVRADRQINTTEELVQVIKAAIPASARRTGPHPAKRTFQALRIAVNDELNILERSLKEAVQLLKPGGRLCVISFHSLEDRIVKRFYQNSARDCLCPKDLPVCVCNQQPVLKIITKKPITPKQSELKANPRARSALLRVAEKL